jgi:hypothetical protein
MLIRKLYYRLRARRARSDIYLYLYLCVLLSYLVCFAFSSIRDDRGCREQGNPRIRPHCKHSSFTVRVL